MSVQERERIEAKAKSFGMSLSDFIRFAALTVERAEGIASESRLPRAKDSPFRTAAPSPAEPPPRTTLFACPVCRRDYTRQIRCACSNRMTVPIA